jgi:hypothetical protein
VQAYKVKVLLAFSEIEQQFANNKRETGSPGNHSRQSSGTLNFLIKKIYLQYQTYIHNFVPQKFN